MKIAVFVTAANKKEAEKIASVLVKEKLVACVNILSDIKSVFWWDKKVQSSKEVLLIAKSSKKMFPRIIRRVKSMHSYELPEIIALPVVSGYKPYLRWIDDSLR